jgi:hypothetical protein
MGRVGSGGGGGGGFSQQKSGRTGPAVAGRQRDATISKNRKIEAQSGAPAGCAKRHKTPNAPVWEKSGGRVCRFYVGKKAFRHLIRVGFSSSAPASCRLERPPAGRQMWVGKPGGELT